MNGDTTLSTCDRCGSFVGNIGLFLVWKLIEINAPNWGYEWKPYLLCRGCQEYVEKMDKYRPDHGQFCDGCGCSADECGLDLLPQYWESECKCWSAYCDSCARDAGFMEDD